MKKPVNTSNKKDMNAFKAIYCRIFQLALKIALPFLPYKDPKILDKTTQIPKTLKDNGKQKPLIVTDKTIRGLSLILPLENSLKDAGLSYEIYDGVVANPTTENVASALEIYKTGGCDCLIAVGGGSPMDCAKGVGALLARPKKTLNGLKGILKVRKKIPLLIAVPTTAGTGSETTLAAVIVDSKTRHKYAINDFPLIPRFAVLDEGMTMSLPKSVVSTTGMDALTHAIEAYIGKGGNKSTRKDALDACKLIFENIEKSFSSPDPTARKNMLIASHKAGRAFSKAYVGYVHALAHSLGGKYDVPHGLANAVILPIVLKEYGSAIEKKLWEIAVFCGLIDKSESYNSGAKKVIAEIEELNKKFNIPASLPVIDEEDIDELSGYAEKEANPLYPVPVLWNKQKLSEMYLKIKGE
ncbi:MAG: iron-containing alcohol dehydrogenase [Candidatus Coproplasma sp.]